ncbi:transporter substrate-binding domain-containing protein [Pseudoalteromonas sp. SR43-2]|uniref:transporter substrate-binding domain-containing protein n=1 Tax=Pseudoalteromonas sp. SR43-2 TaxID=2760944 RepID=UPI0015FC79AA|nr:transporter substrate-binding domain-containing protein [Pseudoalteromonas sp. SR43-2]MBB1378600.1 transporter substrate-binding domain-containing protein [Pseudoalteromonas sp. SR43-2]
MIKLLIFIVVIAIPTKVFSEQTWQIVTENYPPYFSENLPDNGWLYEITQSALKTQGINSEAEFTTWDRALKLLEKKRKTAILGAFYSLKRNEVFYYSRPLAVAHSGIFKRKESAINFDGTVQSLTPYSIGTEDNAFVSQEFTRNTELAITSTKSLPTSLYLLQQGRIDLVAGTKEVGKYWLEHNNEVDLDKNKIEYLLPDLASHKLYLVVSKSNYRAKEYLQKFNRGIDIIIENGSLAEIMKKHNFSNQKTAEYINFLKEN